MFIYTKQQMNIQIVFFRLKMEAAEPPKRWCPTATLQSITTQKTSTCNGLMR